MPLNQGIAEPSSENPLEVNTQRPTTGPCAESARLWNMLSPEWDVFIKPFPSKIMDLCARGGRKTLRARGGVSEKTASSRYNREKWTHSSSPNQEVVYN